MGKAIGIIGRYPVFVETRKVLMVLILTGHDKQCRGDFGSRKSILKPDSRSK